MSSDQIIVRSSPFLFLKRLAIIEFFFALFPFAITALASLLLGNLSETYQLLPFARSLSLNLFIVILVTSLQVVIIATVFISWYFPVYVIDHRQITYHRGSFLGNKKLVMLSDIQHMTTRQGRLASSLNYGTLNIFTSVGRERVLLKDIPDPYDTATLIEDRVQDSGLYPGNLDLQSTDQLIAIGEHQFVEFKSSLVWDYHQQRANKALHQPVMKTLVAFMNSSGGYLLIGVDDERQILGLEPDLTTLRKPNADAFETAFNAAFNKMIGAEFREYIDVAFPTLENKLICVIRVSPANDPIFLVEKGEEKFYIRAGNASQSLTISQANRYIQRRFSN